MLLLLWLFLVFLLLLKVKEKAPVWEGKERDERQRLLLYSFVSTLHHHRLSLLSSLLTCKQQSLCFEGRNPHYSFPSLSDLRTVFFMRFSVGGGQGRTCERYILWSVVMPSTPAYIVHGLALCFGTMRALLPSV